MSFSRQRDLLSSEHPKLETMTRHSIMVATPDSENIREYSSAHTISWLPPEFPGTISYCAIMKSYRRASYTFRVTTASNNYDCIRRCWIDQDACKNRINSPISVVTSPHSPMDQQSMNFLVDTGHALRREHYKFTYPW